jgi:hypothetical protein
MAKKVKDVAVNLGRTTSKPTSSLKKKTTQKTKPKKK